MNKIRGQNMVLLALTMLFMALMVMMTIGLGFRIRQKHELQNLADAAAYSNAVMTARAYNDIALVNRLQVSHYVSMMTSQALISWTSYARGFLGSLDNAADNLRACNGVSNEAKRDANRLKQLVAQFDATNFPAADWETNDTNAGTGTRAIQGAIAGLRGEITESPQGMEHDPDMPVDPSDPTSVRLRKNLENDRITKAILDRSGVTDVRPYMIQDPTQANQEISSGAYLSLDETMCDYGSPASSEDLNYEGTLPEGGNPYEGKKPLGFGLCSRSTWNTNQREAAMGTQGAGVAIYGGGIAPKIAQLIRDATTNDLRITGGSPQGHSHFGVEYHAGLSTKYLLAEHHGNPAFLEDKNTDCTGTGLMKEAHVRSTDRANTRDEHTWGPSLNGAEDEPSDNAKQDHTMGSCGGLCPSVWVRSMGFQGDKSAANMFGQPRSVVVLERDLQKANALARMPWELKFGFKFRPSSPVDGFDAQGLKTKSGGATVDISKQRSLSTGFIYYHKDRDFKEFPNLLNPFWRATLVASDIDDDMNSVKQAIGGGYQAQVLTELQASGFKGLY
jgi:hypothetical protein